jgi:hypothetical protein
MAVPTLIMCAGKNPRFAASAMAHGWVYGAQLPGTVYGSLSFADQNWRTPRKDAYLAALAVHRPALATVLDWEHPAQYDEIMQWAAECAALVDVVIIIPKVPGTLDAIPQTIGAASVRLGYSVPTSHGGTQVPVWEFGTRPVHLLGGSPHKQMDLCHYLNVVSADGNMASKMAHRATFWRKRKGQKGHWVNLHEIGRGDEHDAPYTAFDLSMQHIMAAWHEQT